MAALEFLDIENQQTRRQMPSFLDRDPSTPLSFTEPRPENGDFEAVAEEGETPQDTIQRIKTQLQNTTSNLVLTMQDQQGDPEEAVESLRDRAAIAEAIRLADSIYVEDAVVANSPEYRRAEHTYFRNTQIMAEEIEQASQKYEDKSWLGYVGDFVDREFIRATLFGWAESFSDRTSRQGMRVFDVMTGERDPRAVRQFAREFIQEAEQEGVLTGENFFAFQQMIREVYSGGVNPDYGIDAAFATLDFSGFLVGALKITKLASLRATTRALRAGAVGSGEDATEAAVKSHRADVDPADTANLQSSSVDFNSGLGGATPVRPSIAAGQAMERTRNLLSDFLNSGFAPSLQGKLSRETIQATAERAAVQFQKVFKQRVNDVRLGDNIDPNLRNVTFRIGREADGEAFSSVGRKALSAQKYTEVQKIADKIGGKVVPADPDDLTKGYFIEVEEALDLGKNLGKALDDAGNIVEGRLLPLQIKMARLKWHQMLGKLFDNTFVGSSTSQDVEELTRLALVAQNTQKYLSKFRQGYESKIVKLSGQDRVALDAVLEELSHGTKSGSNKSWDTELFKQTWAAKHAGEQASKEVLEAFNAARTISEAAYYFKATQVVQTFIEKGFKNTIRVNDNFFVAAKRTTKRVLSKNEKVINVRTGEVITRKNIDKDATVWELSEPSGSIKYAVNTDSVKAVSPEDVLGYTAYSRRTNPLARQFVMLQSGNGSAKAILATFSTKESNKAIAQLENIRKAYADGLADEDLIRVIEENSEWNRNLIGGKGKSAKDIMDDWLKENNLTQEEFIQNRLVGKLRDDMIDDPTDAVFGDKDAYSYVSNQMRRRDMPLTEYGGKYAYNPDPIDSIISDYGSASHRYANGLYTQRAMAGWVNTAKMLSRDGKSGVSVDFGGVSTSDWRKAFLNAKVSGTSEAAQRLRRMQTMTQRRMGMSTPREEFLKQKFGELTEAFYDMSGIRFQVGSPQDKLLSFGFFSAFSFNLSQALMQGSQIMNIVAISPKYGLKAAAGQVHLRAIMFGSDDVATEALGLERFAKTMNVNLEEAQEMAEFFRQTLPNIVANDIIEHGTSAATDPLFWRNVSSPANYAAKKFGRRALDVGMIPFNLGESTAKSTAYLTAILEHKARVGGSILSRQAIENITRRAEVLTQNMSNASRSGMQYGLGKLPTQWLSYFFRTSEEVWLGRNLSGAERARLGAVIYPLYGTTGLGFGFAAEKLAEWWGLDPNDETDRAKFITLKYGFIDGFLNYFTPFEAGLSERMSVANTVWDLWDKIGEESVFEAFGGPSASIATDLISAFYNMGAAAIRGETTAFDEDLVRVLRNFSGVNNLVKAAGIFQNGVYKNKGGVPLPLEMSTADAIIAVTGFTPLQVVEYYGQMGRYFDLNLSFRNLRREVLDKSNLAWGTYAEDPQRASEILRDIEILISNAGALSLEKQEELRRLITPRNNTFIPLLNTLADHDKTYALDWANSILNGN